MLKHPKITEVLHRKFVVCMEEAQLKELNKKQLGDGLKGLRMIHGITLDDLSFYVGKDPAYLSRLENGLISPRFDTISTILTHYDMSMKEFYDTLDKLT